MILIITKNGKVVEWNYKRLLKHLMWILMVIYMIVAFIIVSNGDRIIEFGY